MTGKKICSTQKLPLPFYTGPAPDKTWRLKWLGSARVRIGILKPEVLMKSKTYAMAMGISALVIVFCLPVFSKEVALKDIKSVFLEYQVNVPNPYWQMKNDVKESYKNEFADKLKKLGFSIVDSQDTADAVVRCYFKNSEKQFKWVALDGVDLEFIHPKTNVVFATYKLGSRELSSQLVSMKEAENMLLKKIEEDYASGAVKYDLKQNGTVSLPEIPGPALKMHGGGALKDLKNTYLEIEFDIENYVRLNEKDKVKIIQMIADKFESKGFNIENNIENADIVARCRLMNVAYAAIFGWQCGDISIEFLFPKEKFTVARFSVPERYIGKGMHFGIKENLGRIFKKIEQCINREEPLYAISNGLPVRIKNLKNIYVLLNREVVYKGKEEFKSDFWTDQTAPLNNLSAAGDPKSEKRIAILVYPCSMMPFDQKQDLKKNGIKPFIPAEKELFDKSYGYVVRYDTKTKGYYVNFFLEFSDYLDLDRYVVHNKEEYAFGFDCKDDRLYWHDLSCSISRAITSYFINKGYSVCDITPARTEFIGMKPHDIFAKLSDAKINKILIVPYSAYTRWVSGKSSSYVESAIGFRLYYGAYLCAKDQSDYIFEYANYVTPMWAEAANMADSKVKFYDAEEDKDGNIVAYREGVIDDDWIIDKTLKKFIGYEKGLNEKVKVGGELFSKFDEQGL